MPVSGQVDPPCQAGQQVAGKRQGEGQHDESDCQWLAEADDPVHELAEPGREAGGAPFWRLGEGGRVVAECPFANREGEDVDRYDREGVGVQRGEKGQREIDPEQKAADRRAEHLEWPGDQATEQPHCNRSGGRMAVEMPQARVEQR